MTGAASLESAQVESYPSLVRTRGGERGRGPLSVALLCALFSSFPRKVVGKVGSEYVAKVKLVRSIWKSHALILFGKPIKSLNVMEAHDLKKQNSVFVKYSEANPR